MVLKHLADTYGNDRKHEYKQKDKGMVEMQKEIFELLIKLGVPCDLRGFEFILTATGFLLEDFDKYEKVTRELYPAIAEKHHTTITRAERAIRHAVQRMLDKGNFDNIEKFFGTTYNLTNSEFLFTVVRRVRMNNVNI